jgi:PKD repeat protein
MPTNEGSRQPRPQYAALSVAGIVVATVFAAVAALAAKPAAEQARPAPSTSNPTTTTSAARPPVAVAPPENSAAGVVTTTPKPRTTTATTTTTPKPPTPTTTTTVPRRPPVGTFTSNCTGLSCTFDATGSTDLDGTIIYYAWSFGREEGGLEGSNRSRVQHDYRAPGTYTVTLLVMDDDGITDTTTRRVPVGGS